MADAKRSVKHIETTILRQNKKLDKAAIWNAAEAKFEKEMGQSFRTLKANPNYNKELSGSCSIFLTGLISEGAKSGKRTKRKRDF